MIDTIAIVGGGISGTLVVLNCLKHAAKAITIHWYDKSNQFAKGYAYSTSNNLHLLNVRASNMSAFPDEPSHFINWLQKNNLPYAPTDFVPRTIYGNYICDTFNQFKAQNPLVTINQYPFEVTQINKSETDFEIITSSTKNNCHFVVFAVGNFLPAHPKSTNLDYTAQPNYFQNPFSKDITKHVNEAKSVTIIGSGLTMVDVVLTLSSNDYKGKINVISPHGYLPNSHSEPPHNAINPFLENTKKYTLLEVLSITNKQLKLAKKENNNWFGVIDSLRPFTQTLWLNFSLNDKKHFLRHLRHKWGVARHRSPQQSMYVVQNLINNHKLQLIKARLKSISFVNSQFQIDFSNNSLNTINTDVLINCTGPESNFEKIDQPLIQNLLKSNIIACDGLKYGLNCTFEGEISPNFYTLGPPLKGILWESIAVPEIRQQALNLTLKIIA